MPFIGSIVSGIGKLFGGGGGESTSQKQITQEQLALAKRSQDMADRQQQLREELVNANEPFLSNIIGEGGVEDSPFYQALVRQGVSSTAQAYKGAEANLLQKANMAGFGYEQPIVGGAREGLESEKAKAFAEVPTKATLATTDLGLKGTSIRAGEAGLFNPAAALSAETQNLAGASTSQGKTDAANQSFYSGLVNAGLTLAGPILKKYGKNDEDSDTGYDDDHLD